MANMNRLYKEYRLRLDQSFMKQREGDFPIFDEEPLSRVEFEAHYNAIQKDMRERGRTVTPTKTIKELVEGQTYSRTLAQGMSLKKAMENAGYKVTVKEARIYGGLLGGDENMPENFRNFWNDIEKRSAELKNLGYDGKRISGIIAVEYFGS